MHPQVERALTDVVQFPWDRPVEVCLKYDGLPKSFPAPSGADRYRFTLVDGPPGGGRVMFFDEPEARRIASQFPAGTCFWIRKRRGKGKGAKAVWDMWEGEPSGPVEQSLDPDDSQMTRDLARSVDRVRSTRSGHGELAVPVGELSSATNELSSATNQTGAGRGASQPQPTPASHSNEPETVPASVTARKPALTTAVNGSVPREQGVILQACALVDAMAAVMNHAAQYGQVISREDVRSLVVTSFINLAGGRPGRNAA